MQMANDVNNMRHIRSMSPRVGPRAVGNARMMIVDLFICQVGGPGG